MAGVAQVSICPDDEQLPDSKVRICDEDKTPESVVRVCEDECDDVQVMVMTGPSAISNGSEFSVTGGKKPIQWQITGGGSIDPNTGVVTDADGGCGTGQVIARDSCGNWVSKDVRYPSGQWVKNTTNLQNASAAAWCSYWGACTCVVTWYDDDNVKWELAAQCGCTSGAITCWTEGEADYLKWPYELCESGYVVCCRAYKFDWECP